MTGEIFGSYIIEYNDILDSIKFNKKFKVYGSDEFETHFFAKLQLYVQNLNLKKRKKFLLLYLTIITFIFL